MTPAEVAGYILSGIVGALITASIFAVTLGGRVIRLEAQMTATVTNLSNRMDSLDKHLTALLSSLGVLLRDDILRKMRDDDERFNR